MSLLGDRLSAVNQLFWILLTFQSKKRVNANLLSHECGCSVRQVGRDFNLLRESGFIIEWDGATKCYEIQNPEKIVTLILTPAEALAIALAEGGMASQEGTPFGVAAAIAFKKIRALVPAKLQETLEQAPSIIHLPPDARRNYADAPWEELFDAIRYRRICKMEYHVLSRNELTVREASPYCLTRIDGFWNLIAFCHLRQKVLTFALDSIRSIVPTGELFSNPDDFNYDEFMKGAMGVMLGAPTHVKIRFFPKAAPYAKRIQWRFTHTFLLEEDGSLILEGKAVRGLDDIRKELLKWGSLAEALEPPELREALFREAEAMISLYSPKIVEKIV